MHYAGGACQPRHAQTGGYRPSTAGNTGTFRPGVLGQQGGPVRTSRAVWARRLDRFHIAYPSQAATDGMPQ